MVRVVHGFFGYLFVNLASVTRVKENEMSKMTGRNEANTVMRTDLLKVAGFSIDICQFCFFLRKLQLAQLS